MENKIFSSTVLCLSQRVEVLGDLSQRQTNNSLSTESEKSGNSCSSVHHQFRYN